MFFLAHKDSGAGSLPPGESYEAAWPGLDRERYSTFPEALAACPRSHVVLQATMTTRSNTIGQPLWCITRATP